jgi:hypothetical protein
MHLWSIGMKKKLLATPELIELIRSNPEEVVLRACKRNMATANGSAKANCKNATGPNPCLTHGQS